MLARLSGPFDSDRHLYEIKWDGFRTLAFVDSGGLRLMSRGGHRVTERYPELAALASFPAGTVLDGEIVIFKDGRPDFESLLRRSRARQSTAERSRAATYVAFDLLYSGFRSVMGEPLSRRRARLEELIQPGPQLSISEGIVGGGTAMYREACGNGLEGVVAKRLDSRYSPGLRSDAWRKIKSVQHAYCAIIGYLPRGEDDLQSLLVAMEEEGSLRYAGRVGTGFSDAVRRGLAGRLAARRRRQPLVPCPEKGVWVEPGLYCRVAFADRTGAGLLRAPRFEELLEG